VVKAELVAIESFTAAAERMENAICGSEVNVASSA
jgi:hypothetical protein